MIDRDAQARGRRLHGVIIALAACGLDVVHAGCKIGR
jgi:hypothetical protein